MSAVEAARLGDEIAHSSAWSGLLMGAVAGVLLAVAIIAVVGTGGLAAVAIGAGIAAAGAGGALAGKSIGEMIPSSASGAIAEGSEDTEIGRRPAARAGEDHANCQRHDKKLIALGSSTVLINNRMAARKTDKIECGAQIEQGHSNTIIGGETARVEGLEVADEVPRWLLTTLKVVAIAGTIVATGGAVLAVGWGTALGGLAGGLALGEGLGYVGGRVGRAMGGELGARIGATIGSTVGGLIGGFGGAKLGGWLTGGRAPIGRQHVAGEGDEIPVRHRDGTTSKFLTQARQPRIHKVYDVEVGSPLRTPGPPAGPPAGPQPIPATSRTPYYSQEQSMSCGVATSRMVIASKTGMNVPESTLRAQSTAMGGYDPMRGTKMPKVVELLQENGVPASYERASVDALAARASPSSPAIAEMKGHVVVVDGVHNTPSGRLVSVRDPNPRMGPGQMREADFNQNFEGSAIFTDGR